MKDLKVLHIALVNHGQPNACMSVAFQNISKEVLHIDWQNLFHSRGVLALNKHIVDTCHSFEPDLVFMQLQQGGVIEPSTVEQMRKTAVVVSWNGDVRSDIGHYIADGKNFDITLFTNQTDVDTMLANGATSDYLQVGYDNYFYKKDGVMAAHVPEIVFLGNNYITSGLFPFSQERVDMVKYLKGHYGGRFEVYGGSWGTSKCNQNDEKVAYNSCKIAINQNHFKHKRFSSDRLFRIMGCGAMALTNWYPEIEKEFTNKKELVWWKDFEELKYYIDYYLDHEDERFQIAKAGYEYAQKYATWEHRFGVELLQVLRNNNFNLKKNKHVGTH